ncbi:esterase-like activity of phytase family protein [Microlunatus elymi]|uniref:Esterase-like activity of phytase family protein n=1 Tax=Microlunatus elymi TaxID=2596828 RepID=A0A516Q4G9_9ACTN|nr:esterase-like activity of phytase family protein [Microlunatus elymi]QDP98329.1 esterase-like activity of phytase family protein [Microlunatus elymi]
MIGDRVRAAATVVAAGVLLASAAVAPASAHGQHHHPSRATCPPAASAVGYSDALDKLVVDGQEIGGLSNLAWDSRRGSYAASVDNHGSDPSRVWFIRDLSHPRPVGDPLILRKLDGTPYTGETADNEGMAVLPDGRFVVSSEVEPSIRIFSRSGLQQQELPVPARFAVAPKGEATENATLEGLTISRSGRILIASMEGTLSGDTGDGSFRRLLVYAKSRHGFRLTKQIGYRVDDGMRIPEIAEYAPGKLLIMEAAWSADVGNTITLYASDISHARDVSRVQDLATTRNLVVHKRLIDDVTKCPDLGATAKETQLNPLMDNFEAMAVKPAINDRSFGASGHRGAYDVTLLSDDNFNESQTTRVLDLVAQLP